MAVSTKNIYYFGLAAFMLSNLHLLRNLSPVFAALTLLTLAAATMVIFWRGLSVRSGAVVPLVILLACMVFAVWNSYAVMPEESYADKIPRFFLTVPFIFIGAMLSREQLRTFLIGSAVFGALGGLSLVVQIAIGPISWFAEASERGGLVRYASLLGSLTILGTFAGIALSAVYFAKANAWLRLSVVVFVSVGCILSLQKAAILNLILFFLFVGIWELRKKRFLPIAIFALAVLVVTAFLSVYFSEYFDLAINNFFRIDDSAPLDDYDPVEGFVQRLWDLPSKLFVAYGLRGMLLGVGMVGGSGALGLPDYPMAHNFVFDMLFIGGVQYLLIYLFILASTVRRIHRQVAEKTDVEVAAMFCLFFYIINLPAATGIQFHPVISSIINLIIGFYFVSPLRKKV
jgi:hypothetical protein